MIHRLASMIGSKDTSTPIAGGRYVRAVPMPFFGGLFDRLRDAGAVVRGDAFAVHWPAAGELEAALEGRSTPPIQPLPKMKW